jgi:Na+/H+ antiporter NhaD/arsenite permease-like protein
MAMDESLAIEDPVLLKKSLLVIGLMLTGFVFHGILNLEPATVALVGAALLFLLAREHPHDILRDVEWPTIFFFIGLFIMVGSLIKVGIVGNLSEMMFGLTRGNLAATSVFIMWFSAFASAIVDNIPYVATMNPLVIDMAHNLWPHMDGAELLRNGPLMPVWWSLALGACLGGNGTLIGASANVVVAGISDKHGFPISFRRFAFYGVPLMIQSIFISMLYVIVRYYLL